MHAGASYGGAEFETGKMRVRNQNICGLNAEIRGTVGISQCIAESAWGCAAVRGSTYLVSMHSKSTLRQELTQTRSHVLQPANTRLCNTQKVKIQTEEQRFRKHPARRAMPL